ncbi:MAG: hypothetical protein J6N95_03240 [Bacilli bacterium]|nr:hypothetical protein [Bacilli bacterium]
MVIGKFLKDKKTLEVTIVVPFKSSSDSISSLSSLFIYDMLFTEIVKAFKSSVTNL